MQEIGNQLKIGIIGISEGNGHPYSWSSIFNGFDEKELIKCPYPAIIEYLKKKKFPNDFLNLGKVTHIWTQSINESKLISKISKIPFFVQNIEDLNGKVDAILLARDDAEKHFEISKPFINNGIPVFIDKPLAYSEEKGKEILDLEQWEGQIFTCSALKFADEIKLTKKNKKKIGKLNKIVGIAPNSWKKYSVHIIEPIIEIIDKGNSIKEINVERVKRFTSCKVEWMDGLTTEFITTGKQDTQISIEFFGAKSTCEKFFFDPFNCFKKSLEIFCLGILQRKRMFDKSRIFKILKIIEIGLKG